MGAKDRDWGRILGRIWGRLCWLWPEEAEGRAALLIAAGVCVILAAFIGYLGGGH